MVMRFAIVIAILFFGFIFMFYDSGSPAIRPIAGKVTDPILLPVIDKFADAVDANPSQPNPRMQLGMTYEGAGLSQLAEATYAQYVEQFPERLIGWYRVAIVQHRMGEVEKAIQSLENATEVAGEKMDAPHWQLGFWYIDVGNFEGAAKQVAIADSKRSNSVQVQIARGRIALETGDPESAIEILDNNRLIEQIPDGYVYQLLGRAYRATGDEEKSREAWNRAGQKKPKWADPWTKNVVTHTVGLDVMRQEILKHMRAGEFEMARQLIDEYLAFDKETLAIRRLDAACDLEQRKIGSALEKYAILLSENPKDTFTMRLLATLRMRTKQFQSPEEVEITRGILDTIFTMTPDDEKAKALLDRLPTK
jgi:tetratricopeptide (TPR) repeat protein